MQVARWRAGDWRDDRDQVAAEEPLQLSLDGAPLSIVMRTPGNDLELALGLLWAERVIRSLDDVVRVRVTPAPGFTAATERTIVSRLQDRMGDVRVIVDRVLEVPRTANGKLRSVVCQLPASERTAGLANRAAGGGAGGGS